MFLWSTGYIYISWITVITQPLPSLSLCMHTLHLDSLFAYKGHLFLSCCCKLGQIKLIIGEKNHPFFFPLNPALLNTSADPLSLQNGIFFTIIWKKFCGWHHDLLVAFVQLNEREREEGGEIILTPVHRYPLQIFPLTWGWDLKKIYFARWNSDFGERNVF